MSRLRKWALALVLGRGEPRPKLETESERIVAAGSSERRAESLFLLLLVAAGLCAAGFLVAYSLDGDSHQTQYLGLAIGLAFAFLAAACVVAARRLVVTEELEEEYSPVEHLEDQEALAAIVDESASRFTRKRLVKVTATATGGAIAAALVTPALSLGPILDTSAFYTTPWRRGRRLVGEDGRPMRAEEIELKTFYTAFPEHAEREEVAAPLVVVRLRPSQLDLPGDRADWAPEGILAYSKICTHAGCAVALYRTPKFPVAEPKPALICPCHYSTFDPATGGTVTFGPAGRPLPQLPLLVDPQGFLRAAGNFSGAVGPAWWGVYMRRLRS